MKRSRTYFLTALLMPLIGMAFLYNQNVSYLSGLQVLHVTPVMMAMSALGYAALYLLFRTGASAMLGALAFWAMFFAGGGAVRDAMDSFASGLLPVAGVAICTAAVVLLLALALRKYRGSAMGTFALVMAIAMALMNVPQAALIGIRIGTHRVDESLLKTEFAVDSALPSPNVYWFHADGMLGFDAFEAYFGDDQASFRSALEQNGFAIDAGAMLEVGHTTALAIPSLLSPSFYDRVLTAKAQTHEDFMALRKDRVFMTNEAQFARRDLETLRAFEQKGYRIDLISSLDDHYPPTYGDLYKIDSTPEVRLVTLQDAKENYLPLEHSISLSSILWRTSGGLSMGLPDELGARQVKHYPITSKEVEQQLSDEWIDELLLTGKDEQNYRNMLTALDAAVRSEGQPKFTVVFYPSAHYPFKHKADGSLAEGDISDISNYAGNHAYAARVLLGALDIVLENDPNAVIVLQADHGLHGVTGERIVEYTGDPDAAIPIWNQVLSAIRVPDQYKNGDEQRAIENPLNMSRFLMSRFVGESNPYLPANTMK